MSSYPNCKPNQQPMMNAAPGHGGIPDRMTAEAPAIFSEVPKRTTAEASAVFSEQDDVILHASCI